MIKTRPLAYIGALPLPPGGGTYRLIPKTNLARLIMSIDKSLKLKEGSTRQRNVLTRAERLARLKETERWREGDPILGLPKVRVMKSALKKKKKAKKKEGEEGEGATPAEGAKSAT